MPLFLCATFVFFVTALKKEPGRRDTINVLPLLRAEDQAEDWRAVV
jgi:hypothetical protein